MFLFCLTTKLHCSYVGQNGELAGCHNDVMNMKEYLMDVHEFEEENMTILLDDGEHADPTRENILNAYAQIVADSQEGDVVYLHYSGKMPCFPLPLI